MADRSAAFSAMGRGRRRASSHRSCVRQRATGPTSQTDGVPEYRSWTEFGVPDGANSHHAAGQIVVIYLVFGDRHPLLIDASHMPAATPDDLAELQAILDSIVIDR